MQVAVEKGSCKAQCCPYVQSQVEILGKVKGKNVPMVMHHSRNSQQKAWDETLVLALAGMGRILRSHFTSLCRIPEFDQVLPFQIDSPFLPPFVQGLSYR